MRYKFRFRMNETFKSPRIYTKCEILAIHKPTACNNDKLKMKILDEVIMKLNINNSRSKF